MQVVGRTWAVDRYFETRAFFDRWESTVLRMRLIKQPSSSLTSLSESTLRASFSLRRKMTTAAFSSRDRAERLHLLLATSLPTFEERAMNKS